MAITVSTPALQTFSSNTAAQTSWTSSSKTFNAGEIGVLNMGVSGSASAASFAVSDSAGNTWTVVAREDNAAGTGCHTAIAYFYFTSTTTCTVTPTFVSVNWRSFALGSAAGVDSTTPNDANGVVGGGTSTTSFNPTTSTALAVNGEVGFVAVTETNNASGPTTWPTSGYTSWFNPTDGTRSRFSAFQFQILTTGSGSTLQTGTVSWTTGAAPAGSIATFQPAAGGGSSQTVTMTGLGTASSVGTATAVPGAVTATMTGLASASSFGTTTALPGVVNVSVNGLASAASFGSPGEATGPVSVPVSGLGSAGAFGTIGGPAAPTEHFDPAIHGGKHR